MNKTWTREGILIQWPQAQQELRGFQRHLESKATLTSQQLSMALQLAEREFSRLLTNTIHEPDVLKMLREVGAIITDNHVVYTSGLHGSAYINKDAVYPYTRVISRLCHALAMRFIADRIQAVIAPAIGGVILSQWVAHHLTELHEYEVFALYAEKSDTGDAFVIKRGYDTFIRGRDVLVVEDVLTTGGSAKKVVEAVRAIGGNVVGVGVLCNRGGIIPRDVGDVPKLEALINMKFETYEPLQCPLCAQNVPINTEVGKGREFLASQNQNQSQK